MIATVKIQVDVEVRVSVEPDANATDKLANLRYNAVQSARRTLTALVIEDAEHDLGVTGVECSSEALVTVEL